VVTGRGSGKDVKKRGCERCERKGYRCIVEYEMDSDDEEGEKEKRQQGDNKAMKKQKTYEWDWVDESFDMEPVGETLEIWKRRKRGDKLELIGSVMQWVEAGSFALPSCEKVRKPVES
jgi:hypothetical protein